jgi:acetyltransferase-like isoleucine patch superfamily enzyme
MPGVDLGGHVIIGKKVFIGTKATIIPKIEIEDNSIVGAGSVVIRKVKSKTTVFGNPAKVI